MPAGTRSIEIQENFGRPLLPCSGEAADCFGVGEPRNDRASVAQDAQLVHHRTRHLQRRELTFSAKFSKMISDSFSVFDDAVDYGKGLQVVVGLVAPSGGSGRPSSS